LYYYQFHIGDYRRDTGHLSLLEHGIYRQLLDLYYISEKPLDKEVAKRLIGVRNTDELQTYYAVLTEFFQEIDGKYIHKRCDYEIERLKAKSEKAKNSVKVRWNKNKGLQNTNVDTNVLRPNNEGNTILTSYNPNILSSEDKVQKTTKPKKTKKQKAEPAVYLEPQRFDEFWNMWPSSSRKQNKVLCRQKWAEKNLDAIADKIISHVAVLKKSKQWLEGFEPMPATYINQSRWEDAEEVKKVEVDPMNPRAMFGHLYKPA
jgi:uncharacterized protein YdaU (DUF1376 family)